MMSQRERDALDRHITGNYGEDQFAEHYEGPDMDPEEAAAYDAWAAEQEAIESGNATRLMPCYFCEDDINKRPLRGVDKTRTIDKADPTESYHLIPCDHWII